MHGLFPGWYGNNYNHTEVEHPISSTQSGRTGKYEALTKNTVTFGIIFARKALEIAATGDASHFDSQGRYFKSSEISCAGHQELNLQRIRWREPCITARVRRVQGILTTCWTSMWKL